MILGKRHMKVEFMTPVRNIVSTTWLPTAEGVSDAMLDDAERFSRLWGCRMHIFVEGENTGVSVNA